MNHRILNATREQLIQQLVFFDEQYSLFFDHYVRDYGKEKQIVDALVRRYRETLEEILAKDDGALSESLENVTLLGSSVKVRFEEDGYEELFTVVFPTDIDPDHNRISFLSPIGRQLLLTAPHETLVLESPVGRQPVQIGEVRFAYREGFPVNKEDL
ncbi:GreA/GreB family elongation factor [Brevibacillus choshinensis]|uniref:GreA/GreB family elongation factor n=1 Tax=Brevibacillus choshinensis TaxID=54911 RepID=UPI002E219F99|nr:GreA/GreB family elongation factor [Brevibacillus choshinensis]MED4750532.1 GreA/GreB family elongation factor [Brevibacillus choshinensis]MED4781148.1 GreA/GreB family elongation factor [Brevibacillus choshinensis]